jgi:hypothetical protein
MFGVDVKYQRANPEPSVATEVPQGDAAGYKNDGLEEKSYLAGLKSMEHILELVAKYCIEKDAELFALQAENERLRGELEKAYDERERNA